MSDYPRGPVFFALIVAFVTTVLAGLRVFAIVVVAGWLAFTWLPYLVGNEGEPSPAATVGLLAWLLVLSAIGEIARVSRERGGTRGRVALLRSSELHDRCHAPDRRGQARRHGSLSRAS